jgi:hypothetical protein
VNVLWRRRHHVTDDLGRLRGVQRGDGSGTRDTLAADDQWIGQPERAVRAAQGGHHPGARSPIRKRTDRFVPERLDGGGKTGHGNPIRHGL